MTVSVGERKADGISAADLLELIRDPERHRLLLSQLAELRQGQLELAHQKAELQVREQAAAALAAEAGRVKADFQARAARLDVVLRDF